MKFAPDNIFNPEWFPLYTNRFAAMVKGWDNEAIGVYIQLLCYQWHHGYLPTDMKVLRRIAQCPPSAIKKIIPYFTFIDEDKMQFSGLEEIRDEQHKNYEKRKAASKIANDAKAKKAAESVAGTVPATDTGAASQKDIDRDKDKNTVIYSHK